MTQTKIATAGTIHQITIPLAEPYLGGNEWAYVKECLDTGWVSSVGSFVTRFEAAIATTVGTHYAVATTNGTAALHLALRAIGVAQGDAVVVPSVTFIAPVNAVSYCGAVPVFMDVDPATLCLDVPKTIEYIERACIHRADGVVVDRESGRRVAAVVVVDVFGHPADYDPLLARCRAIGIPVVEDACEALGSRYRGRAAGGLADIGTLSFNGNKIVTAGGGGMVCTDREDWARRVRHLSTQANADPIAYDHDAIGYNYRLTNVQAAIGFAQLEQLDRALAAKRRIAVRYIEAFAHFNGVAVFEEQQWAEWNHWLSTIALTPERAARCVAYCREQNVQVRPVWRSIPLLPMYRDCSRYRIDHAFDVAARVVNLPSSVGLTDADQDRVIATVREAVSCDVTRNAA